MLTNWPCWRPTNLMAPMQSALRMSLLSFGECLLKNRFLDAQIVNKKTQTDANAFYFFHQTHFTSTSDLAQQIVYVDCATGI